jgi:hypothetical protein
MDKEAENESLEDNLQNAQHQKRRHPTLHRRTQTSTFTEIKKAAGIEDNSSVSYHLTNLQTLVTQKDEKCSLTDLGQEAYNLIVKTNAYTSTNIVVSVLRRQLLLLIIANAILWAIAVFATRQFEGVA